MIDIDEMIQKEIENGYESATAQAKVCQDLILKAIATSSLNRNVTIKGGVVMRSKTKSVRRATKDLDLDFIKYSLSDDSIDLFVKKINCLDGLEIVRVGKIKELKQQDYHGKRIYVRITDSKGFPIENKIDFGVHNRFDIELEEYCFDIAYDDEGASLLINSNEQMMAEKIRSLLKLGPISTRYKDVYDICYLSRHVDRDKLDKCLYAYVLYDPEMRENDMDAIYHRLKTVFEDNAYLTHLMSRDVNWLGEDVKKVLKEILDFVGEYTEN